MPNPKKEFRVLPNDLQVERAKTREDLTIIDSWLANCCRESVERSLSPARWMALREEVAVLSTFFGSMGIATRHKTAVSYGNPFRRIKLIAPNGKTMTIVPDETEQQIQNLRNRALC